MSGSVATVGLLRNGQPFRVTAKFLSDWACSTGSARHGSVDREVRRDADDFPMVPGKTLAAVLRDAAETVAAGLDEASVGLWHDWVDVIFGRQRGSDDGVGVSGSGPVSTVPARSEPLSGALQARPLRIAEPIRAAIAKLDEFSQRLVREAMVRLRLGVRIDPITGTAIDDMLRIEELASAGLTVQADWRLTFSSIKADEVIPWEAEFLLLAAAKLTDSIGGKRRRGAGRCVVKIALPDTDHPDRLETLLDQLDIARSPREAGVALSHGKAAPSEPLGARSQQRLHHRCDLRITALTPLLVIRGEAGNLVRTEPYIPGRALLPMVARAVGPRATELITGSRIVVTDATVEIDRRRSVPMPRALQAPKDADASELVNVLRPGRDNTHRLRPLSAY